MIIEFKKQKKLFDTHYNYEGKLLSDNLPFAVQEAYKKLRTNLIFSFAGEKTPVFAVTSYQSKTGKTITSANIAISFAMIGKKAIKPAKYVYPPPIFVAIIIGTIAAYKPPKTPPAAKPKIDFDSYMVGLGNCFLAISTVE